MHDFDLLLPDQVSEALFILVSSTRKDGKLERVWSSVSGMEALASPSVYSMEKRAMGSSA